LVAIFRNFEAYIRRLRSMINKLLHMNKIAKYSALAALFACSAVSGAVLKQGFLQDQTNLAQTGCPVCGGKIDQMLTGYNMGTVQAISQGLEAGVSDISELYNDTQCFSAHGEGKCD
jgi:hypothetical protein